MSLADGTDDQRGERAEATGYVIGNSKSGSADRGGKQFAAEDSGSGEKSSAEKSGDGGGYQNRARTMSRCKNGDEDRGHHKINDDRPLAAKAVRENTKQEIAGQHSHKIQNHEKGCDAEHLETASALCGGQRQVCGHPGEKSPPGEHPESVHREKSQETREHGAPQR